MITGHRESNRLIIIEQRNGRCKLIETREKKGKLFLSNKFISGTKIRKHSFHNNPMRKIALVIFLLNVIIKVQKVNVETEFKLGLFLFQMPHGFNIDIYCD